MTNPYTPAEFVEALAKYGISQVLPPERIIYKYVSFDTAIKILEGMSLQFSAATSFNDPFDLTNSLVDKTCTDLDLNNWLDSLNLEPAKRKWIYEDNIKNPTQMADILDGILHNLKTMTGVCCFSKSYKKTLMWSHYADKHSGICLGFNIVPIGIKNFTLLEVNYIDKIIPLHYFSNKHITLLYWLYTKSKVWEYEEEIRAVYQQQTGIIPFEKKCLKQIHFGLKTTKEQRYQVGSILLHSGYSIEKTTLMEMDSNTFDLKESPY